MNPVTNLHVAALAMAMAGAGRIQDGNIYTPEREALRQQRELERLRREQRELDIYNRRHKRRTGGSLLSKASRARGRL